MCSHLKEDSNEFLSLVLWDLYELKLVDLIRVVVNLYRKFLHRLLRELVMAVVVEQQMLIILHRMVMVVEEVEISMLKLNSFLFKKNYIMYNQTYNYDCYDLMKYVLCHWEDLMLKVEVPHVHFQQHQLTIIKRQIIKIPANK
jgi:hypothetical protein